MCLRHVEMLVIWNDNAFCLFDIQKGAFLSTTFYVTEVYPERNSAKCELLRLYIQFYFTKILKALQFFVFIAFWWKVLRPH